MTYDQFDIMFDEDDNVYDEYLEYILENAHGDRVIANGDMLIDAAEEGYLFEDFREYWLAMNG